MVDLLQSSIEDQKKDTDEQRQQINELKRLHLELNKTE